VVRQTGFGTINTDPLCRTDNPARPPGCGSCCGQERSCENADYCCAPVTWNEATYRSAKGEESWFHWVEDFVRRDIWTYFTPEALDNLTYDLVDSPGWTGPSSLVASAQLKTRCSAAIQNFEDLFQIGRWVRNENQLQTSCTSRGYYPGWTATGPVDQARHAAAAKRVFRGRVPSVSELATFASQASALIAQVPRYSDGSPRGGSIPVEWGNGAWENQPPWPIAGNFFWYKSGSTEMTPVGWAKQFLDLFAPGVVVQKMAIMTVAKRPTATSRRAVLTRALSKSQKGISDEGGRVPWSSSKKAVVAAAGVSLVAIAFMLLV
jgi:hypothetical protein